MVKRVLGLILLAASCAFAQNPAPPVTGQITAATTNATCANNGVQNGGAVDQPINSFTGAVGISVTGTWAATLNIQTTVDHGKTWTASGGTFTANQQSVISSVGNTDVCVFASAYTSGTAIVTFATSAVPPASGGGTGASASQTQGAGASGSAVTGNPVLIAGSDGVNARTIATSNGGVINTVTASADSDAVGNGSAGFFLGGSAGVAAVIFPHFFNGTSWDRAITCPNTTTFSVASTTTQIIAASGSTKVRICSLDLNPSTATAGTVDLVYGTGANCGTGTTTLTGAYTLPAAAIVDITPSTLGPQSPLTTPASQAVCVRTVTSTVNGFVVWEQH